MKASGESTRSELTLCLSNNFHSPKWHSLTKAFWWHGQPEGGTSWVSIQQVPDHLRGPGCLSGSGCASVRLARLWQTVSACVNLSLCQSQEMLPVSDSGERRRRECTLVHTGAIGDALAHSGAESTRRHWRTPLCGSCLCGWREFPPLGRSPTTWSPLPARERENAIFGRRWKIKKVQSYKCIRILLHNIKHTQIQSSFQLI